MYLLQSYTLRRCSVFPKLYPIPKLFSCFLSLSVFLPCPATPNSKLCLSRPSQGLRFLSVLSCRVLSARAYDDTFSLFLSIPTPIYHETDRIVGVSSRRPPDQNETKKREFTSIAASDQTEKSRCICIIVHIYIQLPLLFLFLFLLLVLLCLLFSQQQQQPKPAPPLPCHKSKEKQRKAKKRGFNPIPSRHGSRPPSLPLPFSLPFARALVRSHSLPFWEVAQVQYIYTYYDPRKNLHVDSLLPR